MTDDEFEEFYAHSVKPLVGQVYLMTGDLHEAQDVVQEAFVRAWGRRGGLDGGAG
ncbi:sigma factor, partial [Streptomyces sp. SID1034]